MQGARPVEGLESKLGAGSRGTDGPQWGSENHGTEGGGLGIRGLADVPGTWVHS